MNETPGPDDKIDQMLLAIWRKNYPTILERIGALQKACSELAASGLEDDTRSEAQSAAHKLAGVLGTFGLKEGSRIASQLETSLDPLTGSPQAQSFCASVEKLEAMIEARPR